MIHRKSGLFLGFVVLQALNFANAANILYLAVVNSPSHHFWNTVLVNGLAARGHNVTVVSGDRIENPPNGVHHIYIDGLYNEFYYSLIKSVFVPQESNAFEGIKGFTSFMTSTCKDILKTNGFRTLASYPDDFRFDLIMIDMSMGGCLFGFVHKFKYPPLMAVTPYGHPPYMNTMVGGHHYHSYIPHFFLPYSQKMNFFQRFLNFIVHTYELLDWEYAVVPEVDKLVEGKFGPNMPSIGELEKRTAIALVSTHPVLDYTRPLPENVIPVGGLHIRDVKPIPEDLNDFIESSEKGVVLFTFGTNFKASYMDFEKRKAFVEAFKQFPDYHFIWKFEEELADLTLPKNVIIRQWLPQSDILAHPKIKAFITHGGLLGTFESIWRGVPLIGVPFGFDQTINIVKSVEHGMAEKLDYHTMTVENIKDILKKVLENPKYFENARKLSARFKDQKEKPLDRAVWWAEWLIRNPDCDYLKSPVLRLGLIVGNSYDVVATICFIIFLTLFIVVKLCFIIIRAFVAKKPEKNHRNISKENLKKHN